jgi:hypothetical protein
MSRSWKSAYTAHPGLNLSLVWLLANAKAGLAGAAGTFGFARLPPGASVVAGAEYPFFDEETFEPFFVLADEEPRRGSREPLERVGVSPGNRTPTGYPASSLSESVALKTEEVDRSFIARGARARAVALESR